MPLFENFQKFVWATVSCHQGDRLEVDPFKQIHLKIPCQLPGTWQISEIRYKSDREQGENLQSQARGRDSLKKVVRLNFRPETAEK